MNLRPLRAIVFGASLLACAASSRAEVEHGELTLSEAFRLAVRNSEQVKIAQGNLEIADATYTEQLTIMGPTVSGVVAGTRQNNAKAQPQPGLPAGTGLQPPYNAQMLVQWQQPIFRASVFDARRAAKIGIESQEQNVVRARQQLMYDVATLFIGVLQARQQIIIAQGSVARAEQSLAATNKRFKVGAILKTQVLLAQIELNRQQIALATAEGNARQAESQLERITARRPPEVLTLPPTPAQEAVEAAMAKAPEDRPDLLALHYAADQARAQVSALKAKIFWPTLDATFRGGYVMSAFSSQPGDFRIPTYGITGVLTIPFFQTGDEFIQVRLQKQRAFIASYQETFLRRQVGDDVRRAIARLEAADKNIAIAAEQFKTAEQNYQAVLNQYNLGAATQLDLVTAQGALTEAAGNRANAGYEREYATYQLLFAEGKIQL